MIGRAADVRHVIEFFGGGYGRSLHVVGEAGVGKTALPDDVARMPAAEGTRVLRADGVEFEADVTYAGLHQILTSVLDQAEHLPPRLRQALEVALGSGTGPAPDRLLLVNAMLALLRQVAAGSPLLLVVDDLPWLDQASAAVLGFVARRLAGTRIGFLGASRSGVSSLFDHGGLAEMELAPLDDSSAHELLSDRFPALASRVRTRVVAESGGNPLALLELPTELSVPQQAAVEDLPAVLPLGERLRALFVARVTALPEATRGLLLLAALDGTGDLGVLRAAAGPDTTGTPRGGRSRGEPGGLEALAVAERERLVRIDAAVPRLAFGHPLIRSAVTWRRCRSACHVRSVT
ncbi:ATP-binding protein [Nonomuraea sp. NPDC052116]|uniref:ATP-binding protein n=1 Tax=Nonomuraea sp. NPDC052116 TaxID=3155665 RepID=UPI0034332395